MLPRCCLAIPVYNEEKYLDDFLDEVTSYVGDVVVIDDGSTDQSKAILARRTDVCVISHPKNRGYGQTIIDALQFAVGSYFDWVITMDCDLQHEPAQIPAFLTALVADDADVVSGSRYAADSCAEGCPPPDRRRINTAITDMINRQLNLGITDAFCGFKACRVAAMEKLSLRQTGYSFPLEFWVQVAHHKLTVKEIPVCLIYNDPSRHFGGELDQEDVRLRHYQEVFNQALQRVGRGRFCHQVRQCSN